VSQRSVGRVIVSGRQVTLIKEYLLLYLRHWLKKLATFNPLHIFPCNGSVTVSSY
jgi:hypothetical protein